MLDDLGGPKILQLVVLFKTRHCSELCTTGMNQQPVKHSRPPTKYRTKVMLIYASRATF